MKKLLFVPVILGVVAFIIGTRNNVELDIIIISAILGCFVFAINYAFCFILSKTEKGIALYSRGILGLSMLYWILFSLFLACVGIFMMQSQVLGIQDTSVGDNILTVGVTIFASIALGPIFYWLTKPKSA
jgi:hypothetical protein